MKAVILAGGRGTRLSPYTTILPKPLMPIGDMPILEVLLRQMRSAAIREIVLTVGHLSSLLQAFFGDGRKWGLDISYSREEKPLGTAGPIALVPDLTETFLVANGDVLTTLNLKKLIAFHRKKGAAATIAAHTRQVRLDLGIIQWGRGDRVEGYIEKPTTDFTVSMGIYVFEPLVKAYITPGEYLDFPDLILKLIAAGEKVCGYRYTGYWKDLGSPEDYSQAVQDFEQKRGDFLPDEAEKG